MRHAGKRIVSTVCALAMLAAMLPAQAMATGKTEPDTSVQQELPETETGAGTDAGKVPGQEGVQNSGEKQDDQTPDGEEKEPAAEGGETDLSEDEKAEETAGADLSGDDTTEANGSRKPADDENGSGSQDGGAEQLQNRIDALPATDTLADLDAETRDEAYLEACAIEDALASLSDEDKAALDTTKLDAFFAWFNNQTSVQPDNVEYVAQIGNDLYDTVDAAIDAATNGDTITLLKDATATKTFYKSLTFTGGHKLTVDAYSWRYSGNLIFDDADFEMTVDTDSPEANNGEISRWLGMSLSNGSIVARNGANVTFSFDSNSGTNCAIYGTNADIIVENASSFSIYGENTEGVTGQGLQLDSAATVGIKVTGGSKFLIDGANRGYVCSPDIYVENSKFTVQNCTANASNGGLFHAVKSTITYQNNSGHGLSAGQLVLDGATVVAKDNGYCGIVVSGDVDIKNGTTITVSGNAWHDDSVNAAYAGFRLNGGSTSNTYNIDGSTTLTITDNYNTGLDVRRGTLTIANGAKVTITGNSVTNYDMAGYGGGIYVGYSTYSDWAHATIPSDAVICNNHALVGGDDIYIATGAEGARSSLTISPVTAGQKLDGTKLTSNGSWDSRDSVADDCTDSIDGWYYDGMDASGTLDSSKRWEAHADSYDGVYAELYSVTDTKTVVGPLALKAAHGLGIVEVNPADITIYMGGTEGYDGVSNDNGQILGSNSLPEPGFYITLPNDVNTALKNAGAATEGETANLSEYLTIYTHGYNSESGELHWKLEPYGQTYSGANGKHIYRIVPDPTEDQVPVPVRLQFTDENNKTYTSDNFDPAATGSLNQHYEMQLYTKLVQNDQVVFEVEVAGTHYYNGMELGTGDLNIRYVTGDQNDVVTGVLESTEELADAKAENVDKAYAVIPNGALFTINDSQVDVTEAAAPSLLFDDVVSNRNTDSAQDYDEQLKEAAMARVTGLTDPQYEAKYLDLVDANNGNVWLRSSKPVSVYWPYPEGTDKNTTFHLVHFQDLNREMSNEEISEKIDNAQTNVIEVENTDHGIQFTTKSFSPFVLMWENPAEQPSGGSGSEENPAPTATPQPTPAPAEAEPVAAPAPAAAAVPQTSDDMPIALLGVSAAGAAVVFVALLAVRKRRHGQD